MKPYLLRLSACLFLCVSLNSFGALYVLSGHGSVYDFDTNNNTLNWVGRAGSGSRAFAHNGEDLFVMKDDGGILRYDPGFSSTFLDNFRPINNVSCGGGLTFHQGSAFALDCHGGIYDLDLATSQISYLNNISNGADIFSVSEVPLPAGIYLFLSGLVGLGLMRGRNA